MMPRPLIAQARAFLGRREAGADRAELQSTLQELHADVFTQIDQEVRLVSLICCICAVAAVPHDISCASRHRTCPFAQVRGFWHQLETATNERQRALLRRLNAHLEGLSRAIEVHFASMLPSPASSHSLDDAFELCPLFSMLLDMHTHSPAVAIC
jgi:hypothetical protein